MGAFDIPKGLTHRTLTINGARLHVAEVGQGRPLVLLHGWPEFWATWVPLMNQLKGDFRLIAPDLRGFGESEKPSGPRDDVGAIAHASDIAALIERMALKDPVIVGHDCGAFIAQTLAHNFPKAIAALVFLNCPTVGVGAEWVRNHHVNQIWYQSFHQLPLAEELVGFSRETCSLYFKHFLTHWSYQKHVFDDVFELWIDNFMQPGAITGGFNWYRSQNKSRMAVIDERLALPPKIKHPSHIFWGRHDPILKSEWSRFLGDAFENYSLAFAEKAGHFVHVEMSQETAQQIRGFMAQLG